MANLHWTFRRIIEGMTLTVLMAPNPNSLEAVRTTSRRPYGMLPNGAYPQQEINDAIERAMAREELLADEAAVGMFWGYMEHQKRSVLID